MISGLSGVSAIEKRIGLASDPSIVKTVSIPGGAFSVYVYGDYAYVAASSNGLQIVDISDPRNANIVSSLEMPSKTNGVCVSKSYAYVASWFSTQIVDISDPTNPIIVGSVATPGYAADIYVSGSYAYLAESPVPESECPNHGIQVIDISDPTNPEIVGSVNTPNRAVSVYVSGSYAYVADMESALIIDVSVPTAPQIVSSIPGETSGGVKEIAVAGSYAYMVESGYGGLKIIDIGDHANPRIVGSVDIYVNADGVDVSGSYAYVAKYTPNAGLKIIKITDPTNPTIVGSVGTPGDAQDVHVFGLYAYVAEWRKDLQIIDVSMYVTEPIVTTGFATFITSTSTTVDGTVNPNGSNTSYYFEYGTSLTYGSTTTPINVGSGTSTISVSSNFFGLTPNTTYHYRIVATSSGGTAFGQDQFFITSMPCPEYSSSPVLLENVTFYSNTTCECIDTESITIGTGVTIQSGATVTFKAPRVNLGSGFHAEEGSVVNIGQE